MKPESESQSNEIQRQQLLSTFRSNLSQSLRAELRTAYSKYSSDLALQRELVISALPEEVLSAKASEMLPTGFNFRSKFTTGEAELFHQLRDSIFYAIHGEAAASAAKAARRFAATTPKPKKALRQKVRFGEELEHPAKAKAARKGRSLAKTPKPKGAFLN